MCEKNNFDFEINEGKAVDLDEMGKLYDELNDYLQQNVNYPGYLKGIYPTRKTAEWGINEGGLFILRIDGKIAGSMILVHGSHDINKAYRQVEWGATADDSDVTIIYTLVVHPVFMKQGIGAKLMEFAKCYAISKQAKSIRLDVAIQNAPAIALYEKCGYSYIGTVDLETGYDHLIWFKLYELVL